MTMKSGTFSATAVLLSAAAMQLSGCTRGEAAQIVPAKAADLISRQVQNKSGFTPTEVNCPAGIEAKVGAQFACTFAGPKGKYAIRMTVTKVNGGIVDYDMSWRITELAENPTDTPSDTTDNPTSTETPDDSQTPSTETAPGDTDAPTGTDAPDTPDTPNPGDTTPPTGSADGN